MRFANLALTIPALLAFSTTQAYANLIITPTYDSSWSADGTNATADEAAITNIITNTYDKDFTNPVNVTIDFSDVTTGLGESYTSYYGNSYATYRNALTADKQIIHGGDGNTGFLSNLTPTNPVPGNSTAGVKFTSAQGRVLGFNDPGEISVGTGTFDSQISLNVGLTHSGGYSLAGVASHEINEALGLGSALDGRGDIAGTPTLSTVGSLDFFRYSDTTGTRSFTSSSAATSYFSDNRGATVISYFNQVTGADYHDWKSNPLPGGFLPQVQDAYSTSNSTTNLQIGPSELAALNDVGYNRSISPAPEPSQFAALGFAAFGALGLILKARKRRFDS